MKIPEIPPLLWAPTPDLLYEKDQNYCTRAEFRAETNIRPARKIVCEFGGLDRKGRMTIYRGFMWDGASGPTLDTPDSIIASLMHDFGYRLIRLGFLEPEHKAAVDRMFYERLLADGMPQFRAYAWYKGVSAFGGSSIRPEAERALQRAPEPFPVDTPPRYSPLIGRIA